jgi:hypothetical protein
MTDEDLHYDFKMSSVMTLPRAQVLYTLFLRCVEVPGDVVEFGAYRGETAREFARVLKFMGLDTYKHVYIFDTCEGLPDPSRHDPQDRHGRYASAEEEIRDGMREESGQPLDNYTLIPGRVEDTIDALTRPLSFCHLDFDLYDPTCVALNKCFELVSPGGMVVIDDYGTEWTGVTKAVDELIRPRKPEWELRQHVPGQICAYKMKEPLHAWR